MSQSSEGRLADRTLLAHPTDSLPRKHGRAGWRRGGATDLGQVGAGRVPAPAAMLVAEHGFQGVWAQELGCTGLVALWHGVGGGRSSQTRDRTCVPCIVLSTVLQGKTRRWYVNVERSWPTPAFERCPAQGREPGAPSVSVESSST